MMTSKAFRKLALSLPETHEEPHFERTSFRVGKKIFATMTTDGAEAMVRVTPRDGLDALMEAYPDVFFSYGGWTERNGALGVRLANVNEGLLREILIDAWRGVASKRARASFSDPG